MINFRKKNANVFSHWYVLIDNFRYSTHEFYREVEEALRKRDVPGLNVSEVKYHEGGVLSDKRVYLRMAREDFAFDICAAPFGQTYFFSVRFVEKPPLSLIKISLAAGVIGLATEFLAPFFGADRVLVSKILGIAVALGLIALAFVWFDRKRKDTYYRYDTHLMYHTLVSEIVKKKVDEVRAANGVRLMRSYEYNPILGEMYKSKDSESVPAEVTA